MKRSFLKAGLWILTIIIFPGLNQANAGGVDVEDSIEGRFEFWAGPISWPALGEIKPLAPGGFESTGVGLGTAFHAAARRLGNGELLYGIDGYMTVTDSTIPGISQSLIARHMFIGASVKYQFGVKRNLGLDAGVGYHLVDITDPGADHLGTAEYESWQHTSPGAFLGANWDIGMGRIEKRRGLFVGLEVHVADFGGVRDEGLPMMRALGPDAGRLDGPLYLLQVGYSGQ